MQTFNFSITTKKPVTLRNSFETIENMKMKFQLALLTFFSLFHLTAFSQETITLEVSKNRIIRDVYTLASDSLEGRRFTQEGHAKAVEYIETEFSKAGLMKVSNEFGYIQQVPVTQAITGTTTLTLGDKKLYNKSNLSFASQLPVNKEMNLPVKFLGWEKSYTKNSGADTALHIFAKTVQDAVSTMSTLNATSGVEFFILTLGTRNVKNTNLFYKESLVAKPSYPNGVFNMGTSNQKWLLNYLPIENKTLKVLVSQQPDLKLIYGNELGLALERMAKSGKTTLKFKKQPTTTIDLNISYPAKDTSFYDKNIIGYIEGTDLKDEFIVLGAHYDHLGSQGSDIFYGADDNASGTATIMELARVLAEAKRKGVEFRRSIVFIAFCAEESGLNGSIYYANNPIFPIEKTVLMVNFDMVGRPDAKPELGERVFALTYNMRKMATMKNLSKIDKQMDDFGFSTSLSTKDKILYRFGSDHNPFVKKNVPSLVFTTSTHGDYHKVTDTPDKINYNNMTNLVKATAALIIEAANEPKDFPNKKK